MNERLIAQIKQRFSSEVLWHFVRGENDKESIDKIYGILQNGLKIGEKPEEFKYFDVVTNKIVALRAHPVSCLADIPFKDLIIHAERYGCYAIGFHKTSAIKFGFNPVLYVNQPSIWFMNFINLRNEIEAELEKLNNKLSEKFESLLLSLGSIAKAGYLHNPPTNDKALDEAHLNNFYYEREWRSIRNWQFEVKDVVLIIAPDTFAVEVKNQIILKLPQYKNILVLPFSMIYRL